MNTITQQNLFAKRVENVPKSFIREILKVASNPEIISFAGGLPNPLLFPVEELQRCSQNVFEKYGMQALQYTATEGFYPLREYISKRYKQNHNLDIPPEQILITSGSQQALDLIGKLFINCGDKIIIERPGYLGAIQCFSMFEPQFIEVELKNDGVNLEELERELNDQPVKFFYSIPNFQNPTGIQYSFANRQQVINLISKYDTVLIEDDPYVDIRFNDELFPSLYSYLPDQTILLGSFSKTVAPGLRLGWMVASPQIIQKACILKQASDLHTSNLTQYILYEFLNNNNLETYISKICDKYKLQKNVMLNVVKEAFPAEVKFTEPEGGMFLWLTLPGDLTARQLLKRALSENIIFVPGDTFYAKNPDQHTLRLNFSNVDECSIRQAMYKLATLIR